MANDTAPPDVTILLSVYDGERFIQPQLDSIAEQRGVNWSLIWRDDGAPAAADAARGTTTALAAFAQRFPGRVTRAADSGIRLGVGDSYLSLLAAAPPGPWIAFADQDDVWLPDKLRRAIDRLGIVPREEPALYCGRQRLVDADLRPIGLSKVPLRPLGFANALVQNVATGCTMVLNAAARAAVLAMPPPPGTLHDWWCYLVVSGVGGRLVYDAEPFILYRQHGRNAVGASGGQVTRGWRALRRGPRPFLQRLDQHVGGLAQHRDRLTPANAALFDALRSARALPAWGRLPALFGAGVYRQGTAEDLILRLWLMLGGR